MVRGIRFVRGFAEGMAAVLLLWIVFRKQQYVVLNYEFFTIYMVWIYHIYIAVLLAIRDQYRYNRIVLALVSKNNAQGT